MLRLGVTLLSLLWLATSAHATSGSYGGEGAQFFPLKKTPVRVLSQVIAIEDGALSSPPVAGWRVQGIYTLENPTDDRVTVHIGLPEFSCSPGVARRCDTLGGPSGPSLLDLKIWVGFQKVKPGKGRVSRSALGGRSTRRVHSFEVTFQPREVQKIRHTYRFGTSTDLGSNRLSFVTRTGSLWSGPIGKATFTLRLLERPYGISLPSEFKVKSYVETPQENHGDRFVTDLLLEQRDWTPKGDLILDMEPLGSPPLLRGLPCPSVQELVEDADRWMPNAGLEPVASASLTDADLRRCRALPRAMHGAPFEQAELREFFYGPRGDVADRQLLLARKNDQHTPWMLTTDEWLYVRAMTQIEAARAAGKRGATGE